MLDLPYLQEHFGMLSAFFAAHQFAFTLIFFLSFILVTALSLPLATGLTLFAGGLYGWAHGLLIVSFATSIGATLAMLLSRHVFAHAVQQRWTQAMQRIDRGIQENGALYLFALRLTPVVPFFMVNLLMGLTSLRPWTFYWVSQLGMLTLNAVYVNAGTQLAALRLLSDIANPWLLASLALLGLMPLALKKLLSRFLGYKI
jgi:uncharacterized membrane protein YdjX (TVP38/TMEM64 family)